MAFELRQELKLTHQLVMTPQLQLAIKLLQMCKMELVDMIQQEMTENPMLEEVAESDSEAQLQDGDLPKELADEKLVMGEAIPDTSGPDPKDYLQSLADGYSSFGESEDRESFETTLTRSTSLVDHLMWQLHMNGLPDDQRSIGELIIGNINQDGYLQVPLMDIAKSHLIDGREGAAGFRWNHANWLRLLRALQLAEAVLKKIQAFDPVGVACRNLEECLLVQIGFLTSGRELLEKMVKYHLVELEKKRYQVIAGSLGVGIEDVVEAAKIISQLEPKPGRPFIDREPQYINPDIHVIKTGDGYSITLNGEGMPRLRVSSFYLRSMYNDTSSAPVKEYIRNKMRSAIWLIKSIYQRERTIKRVMESIIKFQRDFFDHGIDHLKPLILKDVAEDINMHESTISRVTTNKYVQTPQGLFELKFFFHSGIASENGSMVSSVSVKKTIRDMVAGEDGAKPLSDQEIAQSLQGQGLTIARRTVAKYREELGIMPSHQRRLSSKKR